MRIRLAAWISGVRFGFDPRFFVRPLSSCRFRAAGLPARVGLLVAVPRLSVSRNPHARRPVPGSWGLTVQVMPAAGEGKGGLTSARLCRAAPPPEGRRNGLPIGQFLALSSGRGRRRDGGRVGSLGPKRIVSAKLTHYPMLAPFRTLRARPGRFASRRHPLSRHSMTAPVPFRRLDRQIVKTPCKPGYWLPERPRSSAR
jgi:hypothetical protein